MTTPDILSSLPAESYLEVRFVETVLVPMFHPSVLARLHGAYEITINRRNYRIDYVILGEHIHIAIELDGYAFHSSKEAFTRDRERQNNLVNAGWSVLRFSYDTVVSNVRGCIDQLRQLVVTDSSLQVYLRPSIAVPTLPLPAHPIRGMLPRDSSTNSPFDRARDQLSHIPLRNCQQEALIAVAQAYRRGQRRAACVLSVGAGKTALGVAATLAFTRRRALVITPATILRQTFQRAMDSANPRNVLYCLPQGPLLHGPAPSVLTLDREDGPIRTIRRPDLLAADVIVTNFHVLGDGQNPHDLLAKLLPEDIDFLLIDEAHISASASYRDMLAYFPQARVLMMSACFRRADGQPIDAEIVYQYPLQHAMMDGHAKTPRVCQVEVEHDTVIYDIPALDGQTTIIQGRDALLELIGRERDLATITMRSETSLRRVIEAVRHSLDAQRARLAPIRPRVLFSALGLAHAEQVASLACEAGIATAVVHYRQLDVDAILADFESEHGRLDAVVHVKMLGQGYDLPPISIVVPMRPYGSYAEFYQFIGRGLRSIPHPTLPPTAQYVDIVFHAELGIGDLLEMLREEDHLTEAFPQIPVPATLTSSRRTESLPLAASPAGNDRERTPSSTIRVVHEQGTTDKRLIFTREDLDAARQERELALLAQLYAKAVIEKQAGTQTFDGWLASHGL